LELSFLETLILGLISGFAEVLPVSAQAHRIVILKVLGINGDSAVLRLMIHMGTVLALYFFCKGHIVRMMRARRLVRIPKNRRKRPLDTEALMDFNFLKTALIPVILGTFLYSRLYFGKAQLLWAAGFLVLNGIILYVPQYLPGSNKQSGALSRVDSLYFGLGGFLGMFPGISAVGTAVSIGSVRGMDLSKAFSFALLLNIPVNLCLAALDLFTLVSGGAGSLAFRALVFSLFAGAAACISVVLAIHMMKKIAAALGYGIFSFYSWGAALLTFLLYLAAA
jgi:undecaprenyl-diphosphatase